jgi:ribosomal protein S18 acetylase RimI-like enzyme
MYPATLEVRPLTLEGLPSVAQIHNVAFPSGALSALGSEAVRRYYEWQLVGPHEVVALGAYRGEKALLGFCIAGVFHGALSGFLKRNQGFLLRSILVRPQLLFNPLVREKIGLAWQSLQYFIKPAIPKVKASVLQGPSFGILAIAVDPRNQKQGVGERLMREIEQSARNLEFKRMHLTVQPSNGSAIAFYEHIGWYKEITGTSWHGQMTKRLD